MHAKGAWTQSWDPCVGTLGRCSKEECHNNVARLLQLLEHLGLCLDRRKSRLQPSQYMEFPGMCLNARARTLSLTPGRWTAVRACLSQFHLGGRVTWRLCLHLLRLMAGACCVRALSNMCPVQLCLLSLGLCILDTCCAHITAC